MLIWFAAALFAAAGLALIAGRHPAARGQSLVVGARLTPGCVIAEGVALLVLAAVVVMLRGTLG